MRAPVYLENFNPIFSQLLRHHSMSGQGQLSAASFPEAASDAFGGGGGGGDKSAQPPQPAQSGGGLNDLLGLGRNSFKVEATAEFDLLGGEVFLSSSRMF